MPYTPAPTRPAIVLVTSCNRRLGEHPFHVAGRKYVDAVRLAGALPLIAPPFAEARARRPARRCADGVLVTGSPPTCTLAHFGEELHDPRCRWTGSAMPGRCR